MSVDSPIGMVAVHIVSVVAGLALAGAILASPKGTGRHRVLGRLYVVALTITALSSFGIYEIRSGRPSVFHVVSVGIVAVIAAGVVAMRCYQDRRAHLVLMQVSVLATVVTGIAQFFDHLPLGNAAANAIVFLQAPMVIGFALIWRAGRREAATSG